MCNSISMQINTHHDWQIVVANSKKHQTWFDELFTHENISFDGGGEVVLAIRNQNQSLM